MSENSFLSYRLPNLLECDFFNVVCNDLSLSDICHNILFFSLIALAWVFLLVSLAKDFQVRFLRDLILCLIDSLYCSFSLTLIHFSYDFYSFLSHCFWLCVLFYKTLRTIRLFIWNLIFEVNIYSYKFLSWNCLCYASYILSCCFHFHLILSVLSHFTLNFFSGPPINQKWIIQSPCVCMSAVFPAVGS